jgi:hypothetical protein
MDPLIKLIERYAERYRRAAEQPNDIDLQAAATDARHALELRIATLSGFAAGLEHSVPTAGRIVQLIDGQIVPNHS